VVIISLEQPKQPEKKPRRMLSLASFNILLAVFSVVMALIALGLLAFVIIREKSSPLRDSRSSKVKRSDSFVPEWKKPENLNPDFLQFHTLMFPKKAELKKPIKNNQIMQVERREQIIDLSGLDAMVAPEKPLPPIPMEDPIYENAVYIEERVRRSMNSSSSTSSPSDSLRSSPFTSSTSLAASQELPMRDFGSSSDMSEIDLVEPPAIKKLARLECASPEERC
ncbi:hypothetical protein PFISCL1PPCAC_20663, partial [Pristionchus fissidentatus]